MKTAFAFLALVLAFGNQAVLADQNQNTTTLYMSIALCENKTNCTWSAGTPEAMAYWFAQAGKYALQGGDILAAKKYYGAAASLAPDWPIYAKQRDTIEGMLKIMMFPWAPDAIHF